jgi:SAM-dependent methyltransferase
MYTDLAPWWPLLSPPEDYEEEAAEMARLLAAGPGDVRDVLELGSGGGHNAVHLSARFTVTLVDISADMLEVSRQLNPGSAHVQGDMRTVRLGRTFDAVFVHDAIEYMLDETDLRRAVDTAFVHCRPGGVALFAPDATREIFAPGTDHDGIDGSDGAAVRYLEWTWDPDPDDTHVRTEYVVLLRRSDGRVECVHETHSTGLFARATWLRVLSEAGFDAELVVEQTTEDRQPRDLFLARRPE